MSGEWFSYDRSALDPALGTRNFAGIFGTHRNAADPITFKFKSFSVSTEEVPSSTAPLSQLYKFDRVRQSSSRPS